VKTTKSRKVVIAFGGILVATLAAGCYGGGRGYSNNPYGYNSAYGSSYPYRGYDSGYSYPQNYGNSYGAGYQNGVRADENRDRHQDRDTDQHAAAVRGRSEPRAETQHSGTDPDKYSRKDSESGYRTEKN
jgi:hypothetical protein